jgi:hypothetical protein
LPKARFKRSRVIVCDCLTLFTAEAGPIDGLATTLLPLFIAETEFLGLTTDAEFERARRLIQDHAQTRPEKFSASAARRAEAQLRFLESDRCSNFEVRPHPTIRTLDGVVRDDHLILLAAAVEWGAEYFCTFNQDLRRMRAFRTVQIRSPKQIVADLVAEGD